MRIENWLREIMKRQTDEVGLEVRSWRRVWWGVKIWLEESLKMVGWDREGIVEKATLKKIRKQTSQNHKYKS